MHYMVAMINGPGLAFSAQATEKWRLRSGGGMAGDGDGRDGGVFPVVGDLVKMALWFVGTPRRQMPWWEECLLHLTVAALLLLH
jgi:hypothetical protein